MPRANPAAELADRLLQILRDQPPGSTPLTLTRLATLAGTVDPDACGKAVKHKQFTAGAVLAQKSNADSLVVLKADADVLAGSDVLLVALLEQVCTHERPTVAVPALAKKVEKSLQPALLASLTSRLAGNTIPESVGTVEIKKKRHLFLKRMPPPPPPKPAHVILAERLLAALESRRDEKNGFPWTMGELKAHLAPGADPKVLKKALGAPLIAVAKRDEAPVALADDADRLASSAAVLTFALRAARSDTNHAVNVADLNKNVAPTFKVRFQQSLADRMARGDLPQGVGVLKVKKQPCFFFLADVVGISGVPAPQPVAPPPTPSPDSPPPIDFASAFEQAFSSLDRQSGSLNLVSLVDLRREMTIDRATFDLGLRELRRSDRFSLAGAEGRHGLTQEQQDAAINENGELLLSVARRPGNR